MAIRHLCVTPFVIILWAQPSSQFLTQWIVHSCETWTQGSWQNWTKEYSVSCNVMLSVKTRRSWLSEWLLLATSWASVNRKQAILLHCLCFHWFCSSLPFSLFYYLNCLYLNPWVSLFLLLLYILLGQGLSLVRLLAMSPSAASGPGVTAAGTTGLCLLDSQKVPCSTPETISVRRGLWELLLSGSFQENLQGSTAKEFCIGWNRTPQAALTNIWKQKVFFPMFSRGWFKVPMKLVPWLFLTNTLWSQCTHPSHEQPLPVGDLWGK